MRRYSFLTVLAFLIAVYADGQINIFVSPAGKDSDPGTMDKPLGSFEGAKQFIRRDKTGQNIRVIFKDGIYYLPATVQFTEQDSRPNNGKVIYAAEHKGKAVISGGARVHLNWKPYKNGIYVAKLSSKDKIDQFYVNGIRQPMARYPNARKDKNVFDCWTLEHDPPKDSLNDVLLPSRVASWKDPKGGFIHAMHAYLWGDMHWVIKGKNEKGGLELEGGWQNNRPSPMHPVYRIAENIFEELDSPGEWYYNEKEANLYYLPQAGTDLRNAVLEIVRLKHLIEFNGTIKNPVRNIQLQGFVFRHTARTFMENKDPLLRSDWTVYRGGAIVYTGAEDCEVSDCEFDQVGGNTIMVNHYNKSITIKGCYIHHSGAGGIVFVGDTSSVRNALFGYGPQNYASLDTVKGPKNRNYPTDCLVEDCLITMTGRVEKQTAPVQISMAHRIRVNHCSIYDVPRAGINISEGNFGGHIIENSDIFNTVLETGDHGSFNSWGRDRYWSPEQKTVHEQVAKDRQLPFLDMLEPNVIRHNRWRCDHGWDIDLDDGSSGYRIYDNLLLNGGLKLREGYNRIVTNNVIINNSLHPHVWYELSEDVIQHNIVFGRYREIMMDKTVGVNKPWGKLIDSNFFVCDSSQMRAFLKNGADSNSINGDPMFMDAAKGDFRVKPGSPARQIGFENFDMGSFGVTSAALKAIAKTPVIPIPVLSGVGTVNVKTAVGNWMGIDLFEPRGEALSAYGVGFDEKGVALGVVKEGSIAHQLGFRTGDLIVSLNGKKPENVEQLKKMVEEIKTGQKFGVVRAQKMIMVEVKGELEPVKLK